MTCATHTITARFGEYNVSARRLPGRYMVSCGLGDLETPGGRQFTDALERLQESTGWCSKPNCNLLGDLLGDYEPAHIFVALNLKNLERYAAGEWVSFADPQQLLWQLMLQEGR